MPDFVPVLGYADDVIITALVLRSVVRRAGSEAVVRHWPGNDPGLDARPGCRLGMLGRSGPADPGLPPGSAGSTTTSAPARPGPAPTPSGRCPTRSVGKTRRPGPPVAASLPASMVAPGTGRAWPRSTGRGRCLRHPTAGPIGAHEAFEGHRHHRRGEARPVVGHDQLGALVDPADRDRDLAGRVALALVSRLSRICSSRSGSARPRPIPRHRPGCPRPSRRATRVAAARELDRPGVQLELTGARPRQDEQVVGQAAEADRLVERAPRATPPPRRGRRAGPAPARARRGGSRSACAARGSRRRRSAARAAPARSTRSSSPLMVDARCSISSWLLGDGQPTVELVDRDLLGLRRSSAAPGAGRRRPAASRCPASSRDHERAGHQQHDGEPLPACARSCRASAPTTSTWVRRPPRPAGPAPGSLPRARARRRRTGRPSMAASWSRVSADSGSPRSAPGRSPRRRACRTWANGSRSGSWPSSSVTTWAQVVGAVVQAPVHRLEQLVVEHEVERAPPARAAARPSRPRTARPAGCATTTAGSPRPQRRDAVGPCQAPPTSDGAASVASSRREAQAVADAPAPSRCRRDRRAGRPSRAGTARRRRRRSSPRRRRSPTRVRGSASA